MLDRRQREVRESQAAAGQLWGGAGRAGLGTIVSWTDTENRNNVR